MGSARTCGYSAGTEGRAGVEGGGGAPEPLDEGGARGWRAMAEADRARASVVEMGSAGGSLECGHGVWAVR